MTWLLRSPKTSEKTRCWLNVLDPETGEQHSCDKYTASPAGLCNDCAENLRSGALFPRLEYQ